MTIDEVVLEEKPEYFSKDNSVQNLTAENFNLSKSYNSVVFFYGER